MAKKKVSENEEDFINVIFDKKQSVTDFDNDGRIDIHQFIKELEIIKSRSIYEDRYYDVKSKELKGKFATLLFCTLGISFLFLKLGFLFSLVTTVLITAILPHIVFSKTVWLLKISKEEISEGRMKDKIWRTVD